MAKAGLVVSDLMVSLRGLRKNYGAIRAVDGVSLNVAKGEVVGLLGPNGAGKSTTMKMLAGFLPPDEGSAEVVGFDVEAQPIEAKRRLGYLPEGAPAYGDMTAAGFLDFIASMRDLRGAERRDKLDLAIERARIGHVLQQPIETLSKGYKRRVGLAQALLHDPPVLVLDEPTDGLDPNQKHEVRQLINAMAPDKAILISTHLLEEVEAVCSRAVIIARGRIVADGTPAELAARDPYHDAVLLVVPDAQIEHAAAVLAATPGVARVEPWRDELGSGIAVLPEGRRPLIAEIGVIARREGWAVQELRLLHGRLDQVFRDITLAA